MIPTSGADQCSHSWVSSGTYTTAGFWAWRCGVCGQEVDRYGGDYVVDQIVVEAPPKQKRERSYPQPGRRSFHR
jgi:hypothetical protein